MSKSIDEQSQLFLAKAISVVYKGRVVFDRLPEGLLNLWYHSYGPEPGTIESAGRIVQKESTGIFIAHVYKTFGRPKTVAVIYQKDMSKYVFYPDYNTWLLGKSFRIGLGNHGLDLVREVYTYRMAIWACLSTKTKG